jgi:tetratricopeptide (TPR) repeat protein
MENITDRIQDYIDGLLQGEDLAHFENRMVVDEELRNLVRLQKEVHDIINRRLESKEDELRGNLAHARANMAKATSPSKMVRMYIPIAVAACLLVFFGLFLFRGGDQALSELPVMQSEIVRGEDGNMDYEDAVAAFNHGKYREARAILEALIVQEPTVVQYQYYAALTYIGDENWKEAVATLTPLAEGVSIYVDEARYYMALAYWKSGENTKAKEILLQVSDKGKPGEKKKALLEK